jgi:hypothetical protein
VQKGMEIKIAKKDLYENYKLLIEQLSLGLKEVGRKGKEEYFQKREKTMILYNTVLNRIKEKENKIRAEMVPSSDIKIPSSGALKL